MSAVMEMSALLPLALVFVAGLATMLLDAFYETKAELPLVTSISLGTAGVLALALGATGNLHAPEIFEAYLRFDAFAAFFDFTICSGAALTALLAGGYLSEHRLDRGEFYVLLVFAAAGAMILGHASDMLSLFLGLETMSMGAYAMIAFRRTSRRSVEAAMKYFLLGSFAAAILLFGIALLYAGSGHTSFAGIADALGNGTAEPRLVLLGIAMTIGGLVFKVSAVPFHQWTPDAYEGAPTPTTTFMSIAVKAAAFAVLTRVLVEAFAVTANTWAPLMAALALLTMVFGNVAAVVQTNVKRLLAYSSIAHAGYVLLGLAVSPTVGEAAITAVLFYLLGYTFSNVLAFGSLIWMGSKDKEAVELDDLAGVGRRHPVVAVPMTIGALSLMGFPPTIGFFGKYYIFSAAIQAGGGYIWLAIVGLLASAVGAYYYLRLLVAMWMKKPEEGHVVAVPMRSSYVTTALIVSAIVVMWSGILPSKLLSIATDAAASITGAEAE